MKRLVALALILFSMSIGFTQESINSIDVSTFSTAGQGDLYVDDNGVYYIGLQDGSLKEIGNVVVKGTADGQVLIWNNSTQQWEVGANGEGWSILGNTGTDSATNFLGTTDNQALIIKTDDEERVKIGESGTNYFNISGRFYPTTSYTGSIWGFNQNVDLQSGAGTTNLFGIENNLYARSGSTIGNLMRGQRNRLWNVQTANYDNVIGVQNDYRGEVTDIQSYKGFENLIDLRAGGNITEASIFKSEPKTGNGNITDFYGLHLLAPTNLSRVTNYYGVHQANLGNSTTKYAFFYDGDDTTTKDFVINGLGNVGIGTMTPDEALDIATGNVKLRDYPNTRDDSASTPVENILYTDADGNVLSAPAAEAFGLMQVETKTANYTLTLADHNKIIEFNSSTDITCTIPTGLPTGFQVSITQLGTGRVEFVGGATLRNAYDSFKTARQYSKAGVEVASNAEVIISGDVAQ